MLEQRVHDTALNFGVVVDIFHILPSFYSINYLNFLDLSTVDYLEEQRESESSEEEFRSYCPNNFEVCSPCGLTIPFYLGLLEETHLSPRNNI